MTLKYSSCLKNPKKVYIFVFSFITIICLFELNRCSSIVQDIIRFQDIKKFFGIQAEETVKDNTATSNEEKLLRFSIENETNLGRLQQLIIPQVNCSKLIRVGNSGDGGKWMCNPTAVSSNCVTYSLGVNENVKFEDHLWSLTQGRCKIFSFDPNDKQDLKIFKPFNGTYRPWKIVANTNKSAREWSIFDAAAEFHHDKIDFLKMDIEGGEFEALPPIINSEWVREGRVCQIFVEMHSEVALWKRLQRDLERNGFLMFNKEPNDRCPHCCEYSYINFKCLKQFGVKNEISHYNYNWLSKVI